MTKAVHDILGKRNTAPCDTTDRPSKSIAIPILDIPWRDDARDLKPDDSLDDWKADARLAARVERRRDGTARKLGGGG